MIATYFCYKIYCKIFFFIRKYKLLYDQFYEIKPKDFKKYKNNGVIRVKKVFSKSEIINLKKNIDLYIKKILKFLKVRKLTLYKMSKFNSFI